MFKFEVTKIRRTISLIMAPLLVVPALFLTNSGLALPLSEKYMMLGTSDPSADTNHDFYFTSATTSNLGSIKFRYCSNSPLVDNVCTPPAGLDVSSFTILNQVGIVNLSPNLAASSPNEAVLSRPVSSLAAGSQLQINIGGVINPSTERQTVFVRISTHLSSDGSGPRIDEGSLAFSTSGQLETAGFVPPYITFCAAKQVSQDCSSVSGFKVDLGQLSTETTSSGISEFSVATNYPGGYNVFVAGSTMTSGNNVIPALASQTTSQPGASQFGINLVSNNQPVIGQSVQGSSDGQIGSGYNLVNNYKYQSGDRVAYSLSPTRASKYTVSYITNISPDQSAGVYNTTLQYIATAQF